MIHPRSIYRVRFCQVIYKAIETVDLKSSQLTIHTLEERTMDSMGKTLGRLLMIFLMLVCLILCKLCIICLGFVLVILKKLFMILLLLVCSRASGLRISWRIVRSIKHSMGHNDPKMQPPHSGANKNSRRKNRKLRAIAEDPYIMKDGEGGIEGTLFHFAIKMGNIEEVRALLKCRPDLFRTHAAGLSPLHYAVMSDRKSARYELCKLLLEKGADCNCQSRQTDDPGTTPFHLALIFGDLKTVKLLIDHGGDIMAVYETGMPVYCYAFKNPNVDVLEFVLNQGIDVNSEENNFHLGLHTLVQLPEPQLEHCKILLRHGAMVNRRMESGATPLALAVSNCDNCGIFCGQVKIVRALLEYGARVFSKVQGMTILEIAAQKKACRTLMGLLIEHMVEKTYHGAKLNSADRRLIENDEWCKEFYQRC